MHSTIERLIKLDCVWILNKSYEKTNIKGLKDWSQWKARADSVKNTEKGFSTFNSVV